MQTDIASWRLAVREGLQNPRIWVSSAYRSWGFAAYREEMTEEINLQAFHKSSQ